MTATKREIYEANTLEKLQALERKHGYKFGWANKIHKARSAKRDGSNGSRKSSSGVVQETQDPNSQDERDGVKRVARSAYLHSHYTALD